MLIAGQSSTRIPSFVIAGLAVDAAPIAAGIVFENEGKVLLIKRSAIEENYAGHWGLPGGKAEAGETAEQAAIREAREEVGYLATDPMVEVRKTDTPNGMVFHTFHCVVKDRFTPTLNAEHTAFKWCRRTSLPEPLHPQVAKTLAMIPEVTESEGDGGLPAFLAHDRAPEGIDPRVDMMGRGGLPYDKNGTVRTKNDDGEMHVSVTNISKAGVNPYLGKEIPHYEKLGLQPDKVYKLLRDPEELEKAAPTFNRKRLLSVHRPVNAAEDASSLVVGTTGSECTFDHPYLKNSLAVWTQEGIDDVESEEKRELSSAYHYDPDMTPGEYEGEKYDGVMRNIRGNHVALVSQGRAGPDVVVGDEALPNQHGEVKMSKTRLMTRKASVAAGALMVALKPVLAQDSKIDLGPIMLKAKPGKFTVAKKMILKDLEKSLGGVKLAQDGDVGEIIESVAELLDLVDGDKNIVDDDPNLPDTALDAGPVEKAAEYLRSKGVSDEIIAGLAGAMNDGATDEFPVKETEKDEEDDKKQPKPDAEKDKKDKPAMDAATVAKMINDAVTATKSAVMKDQREIAEAREAVRPVVGSIAMDAACGADVYRAALEVLGVEGAADLHADALIPVFNATKKPAAVTHTTKSVVAMDAAATASFATRYPGASVIKTL